VSRLHSFLAAIILSGLAALCARADTYRLTDGTMLSGEIITFNDNGVIVRGDDGTYSERSPWNKFSQDDLKKLAKNEKIAPYVEFFIEPPTKPHIPLGPIDHVNEPPKLPRPDGISLLGSLFGTGVGWFMVVLIYAANLYAGYEIAIYRARPFGLVCGLAAIPFAGLVANIVFLWLPTQLPAGSEEETQEPAAESTLALPTAEPGGKAGPEAGGSAESPAGPGGLRLAHDEPATTSDPKQPAQVFQRGAFTFNRRFFETKFPGFFGVIKRDAEKDLVLFFKTMRGQFTAQRITRISANDLHLEVHKGNASEEISLHFAEIQEIQLKHKDA
jgi:hypothetical protein